MSLWGLHYPPSASKSLVGLGWEETEVVAGPLLQYTLVLEHMYIQAADTVDKNFQSRVHTCQHILTWSAHRGNASQRTPVTVQGNLSFLCIYFFSSPLVLISLIFLWNKPKFWFILRTKVCADWCPAPQSHWDWWDCTLQIRSEFGSKYFFMWCRHPIFFLIWDSNSH